MVRASKPHTHKVNRSEKPNQVTDNKDLRYAERKKKFSRNRPNRIVRKNHVARRATVGVRLVSIFLPCVPLFYFRAFADQVPVSVLGV